VRAGAGAQLYDDQLGRLVQARTLGPVGREVYNRYLSPPHTAVLFSPLSALPFGIAVLVWALLSLGALALVPRLLGFRKWLPTAMTCLAFVPVADGFAAGQNALFTLLLLALSFHLWQRDHGWLAGVALGLIASYKPQLILGPALYFLLEVRRDPRPLLGLAAMLGLYLAIDVIWFPAESARFLAWGGAVTAGQEPLWRHLRPGGELTVLGFFQLALPFAPRLAIAATFVVQLAAVLGFILLYRRLRHPKDAPFGRPLTPRSDRALFALATLLSLWLTPHALLYEWTLLILPALLLVSDHGGDARFKLALVVLGLGVPIAVRIARAEWDHFGWALHPALPLLAFGTIIVVNLVLTHKPLRMPRDLAQAAARRVR
jgi:hypothetical protein